MTNPVIITLTHRNRLATPFGPVGSGMDRVVMITPWVVGAALAGPVRICRWARRALAADGTAVATRDGRLTITAGDQEIVYDLYPAEFDDCETSTYLGVRQ